MDIYELLYDSQLFRGLEEDKIRSFLNTVRGEFVQYKKGDTIFHVNECVDRIGLIIQGWVKVTRVYADDSRIHLQSLLEGSCVGLDIVTTRKGSNPFDMIAAAETEVFFIPAEVILSRGILDRDLQMTLLTNVLSMISSENIKNYYRIETLANNGLRRRIESFLLKEMKRYRSNQFQIRFNREELAEYLCVNRSALSHELSLMQADGLITFDKNEFEILPPLTREIYYG